MRNTHKNKKQKLGIAALVGITACHPFEQNMPIIPSIDYAKTLKQQQLEEKAGKTPAPYYLNSQGEIVRDDIHAKAKLRWVAGSAVSDEIVSNEGRPEFETYESTLQEKRDYNGPLSLGDPGVSASLYRESRGNNDIFRDQRAWQPLDLITIVVLENSEGTKEADTQVQSTSTVAAAIQQLFSFDDDVVASNPDGRIEGSPAVDPSSLVNATVQNNYRGEGETSRRGTLRAKISAMVAEVLPSGILRVEGQKIISVNNEEQVMVISGLVRPRDITFNNEIDSAKIANMRIDYYGKGTVGEAQIGGWLGRLMRIIWPF